MSRIQATGISYFPIDVDFFSDKKVKILKARYGADGIAVYLYILCQIYREGYYTRVDDDFKFMMSSDLNMSADKVEQVMLFLFERSMFDEQLLKSDDVITGTGIQKRWQEAVKTRAAKTPITVDGKYWLLSSGETRSFIKVTQNADTSQKKADNSENYPYKVKKGKVKEGKVEEEGEKTEHYRITLPASATSNITLPEIFYRQLSDTYPGFDIPQVLREIRLKLIASGYPCQSEQSLCKYVTAWFRNLSIDKEKLRMKEADKTTDTKGRTREEAEALNKKIRNISAEDI